MNSYPFKLLLIGLLCGQLVLASAELGARHAYGHDFIRFGHEQIDAAVLANNAPPTPAADRKSSEMNFLRQVAALEEEGGPYTQGLSESLYDLGRFYQSSGDASSALAIFRRALHVVRVNKGLNSAAQIPLLRATLDTYRMNRDFEGLDDKYDYYFNLLAAGQPPHTDLRLNAALAYLRWQREALRLEIDRRPERRLYNLLRLNNDFLNIINLDASLQGEWFAPFALSQVKNLYLLQAFIEPRVEVISTSRSPFDTPVSRLDEDPVRTSLQRQRSQALNTGSDLLQEALIHLPQTATAEERGGLELSLADWHAWNEGAFRAGDYYNAVVETLSAAGRQDLLLSWLGEPVELPDNGVYFQHAFGSAMPASSAIQLQFDVSESGRASNIALLEQPHIEGEREAKRIMRRLRSVQFRPRWQNGLPQPAQTIQRQYVWLETE